MGALALAVSIGLTGAAVAAPAGPVGAAEPSSGKPVELSIDSQPLRLAEGGPVGTAIAVNGSVPGPVLRLREGEEAVIRVTNHLDEVTSIHWHGLILPPAMDGVPGVSFAGIPPKSVFTYRFPVRQSGTYWAHSHSGGQELVGLYFPVIVEPAVPEPFRYDRDYVVMLSEYSFEPPERIISRLKKQSGYYNYQRRTTGDLVRDAGQDGLLETLKERWAWSKMRMDPTDLADVTGATYTYLMNGRPPDTGWTGLFRPGERVRLRFIDAGAMTLFDVRIPGLKMTLVQADGQNVRPVEIEEFRIGPGETYDVIVEPEDRAYTVFAETLDRSGYTRGTLAPREGMVADLPPRRPRVVRTLADMGMEMSSWKEPQGGGPMEMGANPKPAESMPGMGSPGEGTKKDLLGPALPGGPPVNHGPDTHGPGNSSVAMMSRSRLDEPGAGLEKAGHKVLVYADLESPTPQPDQRQPDREVELHLTGNMDRYLWSFDGKKYSEARTPIPFRLGERLRLTFVNDTMMEHPIHLHGMWMELENGRGRTRPRKHTVVVKPGERLSVAITADAAGRWAMHCHLLLHMEMGMFRVVEVAAAPSPAQEPGAPASATSAESAGWPEPIADSAFNSLVLFDVLEFQRLRNLNALRWDVTAWAGGDINRIWLKSSGELNFSSPLGGEADLQLLYGRLISPFFDVQAGARIEQHNERTGTPRRVFLALGLQGIAPGGFDVEPMLFLSNKLKVSGRFTAFIDLFQTQRLVLQPRIETEFSFQRDDEFGVDPGINNLEGGVRLRYELLRELAPYLGAGYRISLGATRDRVVREGGNPGTFIFAGGLRTWF